MNIGYESRLIHGRSIGSENYEDGVRYRVVACRKRLRTIRAQHVAQVAAQMSAQLEDWEVDSAKVSPRLEPVRRLSSTLIGLESQEEAGRI